MSDTEQDWKPNPRRPQSTIAQAFSLELDSKFMLDNDVDHLTQTIEQKKQMMTIQARELQALQEKIREAEERLREQESRLASPSRSNGRHSPNDEGSRQGGEGEESHTRSPTSSPTSDGHPSDEGFTDSATSAATSNDLGSEDEHEDKGKARES
ncbi:hypothetical protein VTN77DRAFT_4877 [Rasamsonia byssochlamydoides]|uniref:uncharacterized protein n=1 Tax=Rasamsonia byssochlamydoides TaxID=89139 RepID=UPI0037449216